MRNPNFKSAHPVFDGIFRFVKMKPVFALPLWTILFLGIQLSRAQADDFLWSSSATNAAGETLVTVSVDTTEAHDLDDWGRRAGELVVEWYPKISRALASDGFTPPNDVRIKFHKDMKGVAATSRNVINVSADYVRKHTNDFGMIIHEVTHVVQDYRRHRNPGWLVEGVADYVRLTMFEPQARRPRIDPERASYRDAYKTTAMFLEWTEKEHGAGLVKKLNRAMREGSFQLELFKDYTGKTVDELWSEFIGSLKAKLPVKTTKLPK
jgi:hypothetical protein